ncbi:MAG: TIGR02449 family protein [Halofilum sp. (in: g-proteobacteria)]|nr:TIGR02449 family protein [Halofilum sp. (in: g-proteobacteria)]
MSADTARDAEARIEELARQVDDLVALCERLRTENDSLRHQQESLSGERARLIEKNEQARARVEAMISRLKAMESS